MSVEARAAATTVQVESAATTAVRGADVPAAAVVALTAAVSLATVSGWLGLSVLSARLAAGALLAVAATAGVLAVLRLRPRRSVEGGWASFALALPALGVLVPTLVGAVRGVPDGMEWVLNADHVRHAVYVGDTWVQGNLSYAVDGYPRGWHSVLAAAWSVIGAGLDPASVTRLLRLMAGASMLLSCLLALSTAHLAHDLAARLGRGRRTAVLVGLLAGSATLLTTFLGDYQVLGYENSILTAVVVVTCCREVVLRAGTNVSLLVTAAGTVVVAHSWQLLLPPVMAAALYCAGVALRDRGRAAAGVVGSCALGAVVLGAPAVLGVTTGTGFGLGHATEAGPESPVPVVMLVLGLAVAVALAARTRSTTTWALCAITILPTVTAVALAFVLGVGLLEYYPNKLLWQSLVLCVPWLACSVALLVAATGERFPATRRVVRGVASGLLALFVAFTMIQPWAPQFARWSTADGSLVLGALRAPGVKDATVVWLEGSSLQDAIARSLLDVLRVADTRERAPQAMLTVAEECRLLRAADRPVVVSTAPEDVVRQRYSCVPDVTVLRAVPLR